MVDMVISDIMMPEMDGFALADSIRQLDKAIPILFMTALDDIASKKKGFRLGIDDYMAVSYTHLDVYKRQQQGTE